MSEVDPKALEDKAFAKAVGLLSYRSRTTRELIEHLSRKRFSQEIVDSVAARLTELGFLNDRRFTEDFVQSRINVYNFGKTRIKQELLAKGIEKDLIDLVLSEFYSEEEEFERAERLALKQIAHYRELELRAQQRRVHAYLTRRGFSDSLARKVCQKIFFQKTT